MKISKQLRKLKSAEKLSGNQKGVALVLVLTVMSLATIMIMTFFSLATSEHRSSATYSRGLQAQQVAEQSVNMVIAQIRKATSGKDISWASQPGAIRTWKGSTFERGFKLYSDDVLQTLTEEELTENDFTEVQNWNGSPSEFVDLNEPVIRGEKVYYPIVDPLARDEPAWPAKIAGDTDDAGIEGFDFNIDGKSVDPGYLDELVKSRNGVGHLALPVRWIYQLADGTMGSLVNGRFSAFSGSVKPTEDNQIVGRLAFWADDETTKLNLNVNAGGLAWDTPRAGGDLDMDMGKYQPVQKEWQRYPGHPATTNLAPVLAPGVLDLVRNKSAMEMIFRTVPRVVEGGSESGTRKVDPNNPKERDGLIPDNNPLFPSVDEYVMAPDRSQNYFPQANGRPAPEDEVTDMLERLRFFVTTISRAPETTLFNTPRIATWPVHEVKGPQFRTPFDELIAFCSAVGTDSGGSSNEYIFKRRNADSPTDDFYGSGMERNVELYNYLLKLTESDIPGVGASFEDKYPDGQRHQILTQIFDYIRCANLHDDSLFGQDWESAFQEVNTNIHRTYTNPRKQNPNLEVIGQSGIHKGHGQVTPIQISEDGVDTMGFGRFYTLKEVGVHVVCVADGGESNNSLSGQGVSPKHPGYRVYGESSIEESDETLAFSNYPPMPEWGLGNPTNRVRPTVGNPYSWPVWIVDWLDAHYASGGSWQKNDNARFTPANPADAPYAPRLYQGGDPVPGNWRQRYMWRNGVADTADNRSRPDFDFQVATLNPQRMAWWNEVQELIRPAFDPVNWNWNLMFNRVRISERVNEKDRAGSVMMGGGRVYLHEDPRDPNEPFLAQNISKFRGVDVTVNKGDPLAAADYPNASDPDPAGDPDIRWPTLRNGNNQFHRRSIHYSDMMRLGPNEKLVQAALLFNLFCPSQGWVPVNPDMSVKIEIQDEGPGQPDALDADSRFFKFVTLGPGGCIKGENRKYYYGSTTVDEDRYGRFLVHRDFEGDHLESDFDFKNFSYPSNESETGTFIKGEADPPNGRYWNAFGPWASLVNVDEREWWYSNDRQSAHHHRHSGGILPFTYIMGADYRNRNEVGLIQTLAFTDSGGAGQPLVPGAADVTQEGSDATMNRPTGRLTPLDPEFYSTNAHEGNQYSFITPPFRIGPDDVTDDYSPSSAKQQYKLKMKGGNLNFLIYSGGEKNNGTYPEGELSNSQESNPHLIQEIEIRIPDIEVNPPVLAYGRSGYINEFNAKQTPPVVASEMWGLGIRGSKPGQAGRLFRISSENGQLIHECDVFQSVGVLHGDVRIPAVRRKFSRPASPIDAVVEGTYGPHFRYAFDTNGDYLNTIPVQANDFPENPELINYVTSKYDFPASQPSIIYSPTTTLNRSGVVYSRMAHDMATSVGSRYEGGDGKYINRYANAGDVAQPNLREKEMQILPGINFNGRVPANPIQGFTGVEANKYGDFDNGMGLLVDGPYIGKPDEGNSHSLYQRTDGRNPNAWDLRRDFGDFPYFVRDWLHEAGSPSYFSPNRIISGPGMFGSMPSGALSDDKPWQTLLFRPPSGSGHPGAASKDFEGKTISGGIDPADHYWMDLFWMPIVEPYAISEPLSTAGKINLNYQILPFKHVQRNSAMRGVLRSELMVLIPTVGYDPDDPLSNSSAPSLYTRDYKHNSGRGAGWHWRDRPNGGRLQGKRLRASILEAPTLKQFQDRFDKGKVFRSASEICDVHLIPQQYAERLGLTNARYQLETYTPTVEQMENGEFWQDHAAIGDNSRERSYGNIYNRVTTKSNTFKVHYRGQVLKQGRREDESEYDSWDEELDSVVGEYRGSSIVERYIDPNDSRIPNYAGTSDPTSLPALGEFYRFRVVNPTRFAP